MRNSSYTYMLDADLPAYSYATDYDSILRHGPADNKLLLQLRDALTGPFITTMKITPTAKAGVQFYVNNKPCIVRKRKLAPLTVYPNVEILEGTDDGGGGSIAYPAISFVEGYAIVRVRTDMFPHMNVNQRHELDIQILNIERE